MNFLDTRLLSAGLAIASLFVGAPSAQALPIATAVVHIGVDNSGIFGISNAISYLAGDARFSSVGNIDVDASGVPTLAALLSYQSILVVTDNRAGTLTGPGGLGTQLGDVLDDYAIGGGRVVFTTFSGNSGIGVAGAIMGLAPFASTGPNNAAAGSMDNGSVVAHPVFAGVSTFTSSFASAVAAANGGTLLASYNSLTPLVLTNANDSIMLVNGFAAEQAGYSNGTQFGLLFANALALDSTATPEPSSIVLIGGGLAMLTLFRRRPRA